MRVLVIGAAGRTGRFVVEAALRHGHDVTAFVHTTPLHIADPRLACVAGDVTDFDSIEAVMPGHTAVAFAVSNASGGQHVHERGIANVIHAMALHDARRLVAVSAGGTFARTDSRLSIGYRALIATTMKSVYDDLEAMERRVMASDLDWTIVRPSGLKDGEAQGAYRISMDGSLLPRASRIARADVASFALKALETDTYHRKAVAIAD